VLESGAFLFEEYGARALAIGGSARRVRRDGAGDVLRSGRTLYAMFHRIVGQGDVLQVRGYDKKTIAEPRPQTVKPIVTTTPNSRRTTRCWPPAAKATATSTNRDA